MWYDKNTQSNAPYRQVLITQLNHLANLAKWLSVPLRTKWLWGRIPLQSSNPVTVLLTSDIAPVSSKEFLDTQGTIDCRFTLKGICDMIRTHRPKIHSSIKHSFSLMLPLSTKILIPSPKNLITLLQMIVMMVNALETQQLLSFLCYYYQLATTLNT